MTQPANYLKEAYRLGPRLYDDGCPVGAALNLVGDRWTLSLLKELQLGARRFSDLRSSLPGLSARALSLRLGQLEERELVAQVRLLSPVSVNVYQPTERAICARPIIVELVRWAISRGAFDPAQSRSGSSLAMSLLALFQSEEVQDLKAGVKFVSPESNFGIRVNDGIPSISTDDLDGWDAEISGPVALLAGYLFSGSDLDHFLGWKEFNCIGDMDLIESLPSWFAQPNVTPAGISPTV